MTYHPTSIYKVMDPRLVKQVAIGRPRADRDGVYLFTGGANPLIVHLTGDYAGQSGDIAGMSADPFLIVDDIEFEVDPETMFRPAFVQQPVGALLISDRGNAINVMTRSRQGGHSLTAVYLNDLGDEEDEMAGFYGFKNWRAIRRVGDQKIELVSFQSTQLQDL